MEENMYNNVEGYRQTFCHTCLSVDRTLFPLGKYTDVFFNIFSDFLTTVWPQIMLCWECTAILKKLKLFQAKVEHSQRYLLSHLEDKQSPLPTLSSLTSTFIKPEQALDINIDEEIDYKPEIEIFKDNVNEIFNEETEININVKEETFDFDDFETNNEFLDAVKIKEESDLEKIKIGEENSNINGKKNYYRSKKKEFKVINKITRKHLEKMCKTKQIGYDEIKNMLKIETKSDFYRCRYKCKSCVLSWPRGEELKRHNEKLHNMRSNFICDYCECRFKSKMRLRVHIASHCLWFECRGCGLVAYGRERMTQHLLEVHRVSCNSCEATFRNTQFFFKHYKKYHVLFICDHCGKKGKNRITFEKHMKNGHLDKYHCEICNMDFKSKSTYNSHNARKHVTSRGEDTYCVECDRQFSNMHLFKEHMNTWVAHMKDKEGYRKRRKCSCPECGRTYARRESMRNHYNYVHMKQSKYVCLLCDTQFLNRTKYVNHMNYKHEGKQKEKNKLCNICGRGFTTNKILTHHIRTHTGERPHSCAHCPARFAQPHALRSHVRHVHHKLGRGKRAHAEGTNTT